jgi:hypothetical protein
MDTLYFRYKAESDRHYEETGELDGFALAEIEHQKHEEYLKKFEIDDDEFAEEYLSEDYDENYED